MSKADDAHLWEAYRTAETPAAADAAASDIIRWHMPFFVAYARDTGFRQWDYETRRDYLADLLAIAAAKLPLYDRDAVHAEGRRASFVTFVKPYLKMARYKVEGSRRPMKVGHETVRLSAAISRFESACAAAGMSAPTDAEVAEHLTGLFGKKVTEARVPKLRTLPASTPFETPGDDGDYVDPKVERAMPDLRPADPADIVVDADEQARTVATVRSALAALKLTPLEQAVVAGRMMAEDPAEVEDIAVQFGITEMEVVEVESHLRNRLRDLLASGR